jgi:hypothetical protein
MAEGDNQKDHAGDQGKCLLRHEASLFGGIYRWPGWLVLLGGGGVKKIVDSGVAGLLFEWSCRVKPAQPDRSLVERDRARVGLSKGTAERASYSLHKNHSEGISARI